MSELSPAASAVWNAYEKAEYDPYLADPRRAELAAALRAAADQVVPASPSADHAHLAIRYGLHRIADELEAN